MLDVHPPHESIHGWRDFLLHLFTITIGLLIALSLEGCVEWQHHRHLVHEAEASLQTEIQTNAGRLQDVSSQLEKNQEDLKHDVTVLKQVIQTHKMPDHDSMTIAASIQPFNDVSWKTAQSTGAFAYMPYATAQEYAEIYDLQQHLSMAQEQAVRDATLSIAHFANSSDSDPAPTPEQAAAIINHIEILQGQLAVESSFVASLETAYKKFLSAHP